MKQNSFIKKFGFILLSCFLMIATFIFAENDSVENGKNEKSNSLLSRIKEFANSQNKKEIKKGPRVIPSKSTNNVTPLKLIVKSIVGEEENDRYAVIEFEGKEITVRKDQIVDNKFKVIDIFRDRIVVYSPKEQRRHTYKLIKEDTESNTK